MHARFFYADIKLQKESSNLKRLHVLDWNIRNFNPECSPVYKILRARLAEEKARLACVATEKAATDEENAAIPTAQVQVVEELELMAEIIVYKSEQGEYFAPMRLKA